MAKKRRSWEDYQKKKIKRGQSGAPIVILLVLLVIACAGLGVVAWVCLRPVTLPHVQPDQASSTKAPVEYETWKATEAAADGALVQSSDPVVQAANLKAMQYDYDGAIAQIQSIPGYADNETYVSCIHRLYSGQIMIRLHISFSIVLLLTVSLHLKAIRAVIMIR